VTGPATHLENPRSLPRPNNPADHLGENAPPGDEPPMVLVLLRHALEYDAFHQIPPQPDGRTRHKHFDW
jgi:hypothetical protein